MMSIFTTKKHLPDSLAKAQDLPSECNYINISPVKDYTELKIQIYLKNKASSWIQMDGEEIDEFIRLLQLHRSELKRDKR